MIKRLGILFWWAGVLVLAFALDVGVGIYLEANRCADNARLGQAIDAGQSARNAKYVADHHLGNTLLDQVTVDLNVVSDPRYTPEFVAQQERCKSGSSSTNTLLICALLVMLLWSVAFVFGGSFWLPAKN
jgi:hypothetical protein